MGDTKEEKWNYRSSPENEPPSWPDLISSIIRLLLKNKRGKMGESSALVKSIEQIAKVPVPIFPDYLLDILVDGLNDKPRLALNVADELLKSEPYMEAGNHILNAGVLCFLIMFANSFRIFEMPPYQFLESLIQNDSLLSILFTGSFFLSFGYFVWRGAVSTRLRLVAERLSQKDRKAKRESSGNSNNKNS